MTPSSARKQASAIATAMMSMKSWSISHRPDLIGIHDHGVKMS
jgi:hypothetical protein